MILIWFFAAGLVSLFVWGFRRRRRAFAEVRTELNGTGYRIEKLETRNFRQGPFLKSSGRSQFVFRFVVREATGRQRTGWARWGRTWLPEPDELEMKWDD